MGYGKLRPFKWCYRTKGPDGTQFDNDSLVDLTRRLRQRYGRQVTIVREWDK